MKNPAPMLFLGGSMANGLVIIGLWASGHGILIPSVITGAVLPLVISTGLLALGWYSRGKTPQFFQNINIIGFGLKIIAIGGWSVIMVSSPSTHKVTFIVTLLLNFLAWHMVEAYHWPLFVRDEAKKQGESS